MKMIKTEKAVGMVLGHDLTKIIPGEFKGVAFKKGHVIKEEDIGELLNIGKEHLYIMDLSPGEVHEDEAAHILSNLVIGEGVKLTPPSEGKMNLVAKEEGLVKINKELLYDVNDLGDICLATIHGNRRIEKDGLIGGCRVIPLVINREKLDRAKQALEGHEPMISVKPFHRLKTAVIVTGSEVYKGRIKDRFGPVIEKKVGKYHSDVFFKTVVPDELEIIKETVEKAKAMGAELIIVTGGMSVDPDDKTPGGIKATGAEIVTYGTPVLPGAMLLFAYLDGTPVFGLPGCVMFSHTTAFDILLPRVFAKEKIRRRDIIELGYGGQCLKCQVCTFPDCHFGKC